MELKLKLVTTSLGCGWVVVGGWTKTKVMLIPTQVEDVDEFELGNMHTYKIKWA